MITETRMSREFSYMGVKLPDPNSTMTPEEVRQFYATQSSGYHNGVNHGSGGRWREVAL